MNTLNLLVIANGFDGSKRVYTIGKPIPTPDVPLQLMVETGKGKRTDMLGMSCHFQTGILAVGKEPLHVTMYVLLLSKQFANGIEKYSELVLNAAINALGLTFIEEHPSIPASFMAAMREEAIASAVHIMQEQMVQEQMMQQARQGGQPGIVTPSNRLVVPGQ